MMMVIAWTSILHAIFERDSVDYFYKDSDDNAVCVDRDKKAWEITECVKKHYAGQTTAITTNLEFAVRLRNKIEHRFVPSLDVHVAGECQALLLNFDDLMVAEFGDYFSLREQLAVPLQTTSVRSSSQTDILRRFQGKNYDDLMEFLEAFRGDLDDKVYTDPRYSFRVYLIPKIGNHQSSSDAAFEFVKYDPSEPEEMESLRQHVALIKDRQVPVVNPGRYKPSQVARLVEEAVARPFSVHNHRQAYLMYEIRATGEAPDSCDTKFCQFDAVHKDYVYTQEWVDLLVKRMADDTEYGKVTSFKV